MNWKCSHSRFLSGDVESHHSPGSLTGGEITTLPILVDFINLRVVVFQLDCIFRMVNTFAGDSVSFGGKALGGSIAGLCECT